MIEIGNWLHLKIAAKNGKKIIRTFGSALVTLVHRICWDDFKKLQIGRLSRCHKHAQYHLENGERWSYVLNYERLPTTSWWMMIWRGNHSKNHWFFPFVGYCLLYFCCLTAVPHSWLGSLRTRCSYLRSHRSWRSKPRLQDFGIMHKL